MPQKEARQIAIDRAWEQLDMQKLRPRLEQMGLPPMEGDGLAFRAFGREMRLEPAGRRLIDTEKNGPPAQGHELLVLHYLLSEGPWPDEGEWLSFRNFPGGMFYWQPFLSRSLNPLVKRIGNDLDTLKENLNRFDWQPGELGDLSAYVHGLGKLSGYLVYRQGDEEFPPTADWLFHPTTRWVYNGEDAAYFAQSICLGLL